jgi:twinkle protein
MAAVIVPDDIDFSEYIEETEAKQKVKSARVFIEDMLHKMFTATASVGAYLPWFEVRDQFAFRPGEVTLWPGINGHGKSLITGQVMLSLMGQGDKVCVASFEMKPVRTLERMARQFNGMEPARRSDDPRIIETYKEACRQFGDWTDGKLWLYDQQGTVSPETIVAVCRYCAKTLGINHIFVDSLMKCVKGEDDYNGQKYLIDEFCAIAKDYDTHIHVIHHIKKLGSEDQQPGKFDTKGSGAITDQVDNILIHWRNKAKENAEGKNAAAMASDPDALLTCVKQRNGEWEGKIGLWFDRQTHQFKKHQSDDAVNFSVWPHRPWS